MITEERLIQIAKRHGVAIESIEPLSLADRVEALRACLSRTDVPYPIDPKFGEPYLQAARSGERFAMGSLSGDSVELGPFKNSQDYEAYSSEQHLSWACLVAEQQKTKHRYACREYLDGEDTFAIGGTVIPDFYSLNARIYQQTGWQLATVNMIIPAELFFTCHSHRFFPVTTFMRALEQDYLQEPDIGHDVAGHVSTFTIPVVAHVMRNHGIARNMIYERRDEELAKCTSEAQRGRVARRADELLLYAERIYWFTVEFGLVMQHEEIRAFGAGILSSPGETIYSIDSVLPTRILIDPSRESDLLRLATTDYLISEFQKTYFVTEHFDLLESLTPERIVAIAERASRLPHFSWRDIVPGDRVLQMGQSAVGTNEKYFRLKCQEVGDECLARTAIRNLRWFASGHHMGLDLSKTWSGPVATVPPSMIEWFRIEDAEHGFTVVTKPLSDE